MRKSPGNKTSLPKPKRTVPLAVIEDIIKVAKDRKRTGRELNEGEVEDDLAEKGITFDDFYWSVLHALEDETLLWADVAALQVDVEPYGQPVLMAFRRKAEIHGMDLKIPHYADLTKRN